MSLLATRLERSPLSTQQRAEEGRGESTDSGCAWWGAGFHFATGDADEARDKREDGQQHDRSRQEAEKAILYFNPCGFFLMLY